MWSAILLEAYKRLRDHNDNKISEPDWKLREKLNP